MDSLVDNRLSLMSGRGWAPPVLARVQGRTCRGRLWAWKAREAHFAEEHLVFILGFGNTLVDEHVSKQTVLTLTVTLCIKLVILIFSL